MTELEDFRREVDMFLRDHPQSPIDHDRRHNFNGLDYFDLNEDLILEVDVERFSDDEPMIVMQTSTGDTQQYRPWGRFSFEVEGQSASMIIYSDLHGHEFFMPFKDATNGSDSYGAGRYMDNHRPGMQNLGQNRFEIDFNYAYNPYCAYSPFYSCPLPPRENWLEVPIQAGEKDYK